MLGLLLGALLGVLPTHPGPGSTHPGPVVPAGPSGATGVATTGPSAGRGGAVASIGAEDAAAVPGDHRATLRAAWTVAFHEAWAVAAPDRRARVRELLAELRSPGAPAEVLPDLGTVEVARRILLGEDPDAYLSEAPHAVLAVQALSLDLRVTPGLVRARNAGRAASLVVDVAPLFALRDRLDVDVRLWWHGPAGERVLAREEPVGAASFDPEGFQMFVRAPLAGPGLWHLVPELVPDVSAAPLLRPVLGPACPVPLVADPAGLAEEFALHADETGDGGPAAALDALVRGERLAPSPWTLAADWLDDLAAGRLHAYAGAPEPAADGPPRLVVVEPRVRAGGPGLTGPVGAAWRGLAQDLGAELVLAAPVAAGETARVGPACADAAGPLVLVLQGDAVLDTQLEFLRHGAPPVDLLVVVASAWRPSPTLPAVPTLYLTPDAAGADVAARTDRVTAEVLDGPVFLAGPGVPGRIGAWLGRLAARVQGPGPGEDPGPGPGREADGR